MNRIRDIIKNNPGEEFVVHTQNEDEFEALIDVLEDMGFKYAIPLNTLRKVANKFAKKDGFDGCWRISESRGIAYNKSVEHWKQYYSDILEIKDGKIVFIE